MNKTVVISTVVAVVSTVLIIGLAILAVSNNSEQPSEQSAQSGNSDVSFEMENNTRPGVQGPTDGTIPERPNCPAGPVAGIDLDCLGGEEDPGNGKPVDEGITLVNIWAWWCEPCRTEMPLLEKVANDNPEWTVVGVHADDNPSNGAAFLNDLELDFPSFRDESNVFAGTLGLPGVLPISLVLEDGEVVGTFIQAFKSEEEIIEAVESSISQ